MYPLSDMLIRIKNAGEAGKETVLVSYSNFKYVVAQILLREGYVSAVNKKGRGVKKLIEITLAYKNDKSKILGVKLASKPSRRVYTGVKNVRLPRQGYGEIILSTPQGVLTGKEAKKKKVGGEVLFTIW